MVTGYGIGRRNGSASFGMGALICVDANSLGNFGAIPVGGGGGSVCQSPGSKKYEEFKRD